MKEKLSAENVGRFIGCNLGTRVVEIYRSKTQELRLKISGEDHLKELKGRPYLVVSNHLELEGVMNNPLGIAPDAFIIEKTVKDYTNTELNIVTREDWGCWWFSGKNLRSFQRKLEKVRGQIVKNSGFVLVKINPGSINVDLIRTVGKIFSRNQPVLIFPEGKCFKDFDVKNALKDGGAFLAGYFNVPILPVYIKGATSWKSGTEVEVSIGEKIESINKTTDQITREIKTKLSDLQTGLV